MGQCACRFAMDLPVVRVSIPGKPAPLDPVLPPLHLAAKLNDLAALKEQLAAGADPNDRFMGISPLHFAACHHQVEAVSELLAAGANPNSTVEMSGAAPLQFALFVDRPALFAERYTTKAPPNDHRVQVVQQLCAAGADPHGGKLPQPKYVIEEAPLVWAARLGDVQCTQVLLGAGASPNACTFGTTALHEATSGDVAAALLAAGADIQAEAKEEATPLHTALNEDVAVLLINAGADVHALDMYGRTPLHTAMTGGVVRALLAANADLDAMDSGDETAIDAVLQRDGAPSDVVEALLAAMPAQARLDNATRALDIAAEHGFVDLARVALAAGADVDGEVLPLIRHVSGEWGLDQDFVQFLLQQGADVTALDEHGASALATALDCDPDDTVCNLEDRKPIIQLLMEAGAPLTGASDRALANVMGLWRRDRKELQEWQLMPAHLSEAIVGAAQTMSSLQPNRARAQP